MIASARDAHDAGVFARAAAEAWPRARLTASHPLAGDASARRYVRLTFDGGGAPATVMAMLLPEGPRAASEELAAELHTEELPFVNVQRFLARHGVPVPEIYHFAERDGVLLLEDVGDLSLAEAALRGGPAAHALLLEASATCAQIAALVREPDPACVAFQATYDRELIGRELEVVSTHGLAAPDATAPRPAGSDPEIDAALARLGDAIAAQPLVLMHRDYHSWNLHVDPRGRLRVIDFQDALVGPALYDLASVCTDRDSDRFVDRELEALMLARFADELARRGFHLYDDRDVLRASYLRVVAYRTLRVIGRFRFLAIERGKPGYLRFLPRMARQTRRVLEELGERDLLRVLAARSELFA